MKNLICEKLALNALKRSSAKKLDINKYIKKIKKNIFHFSNFSIWTKSLKLKNCFIKKKHIITIKIFKAAEPIIKKIGNKEIKTGYPNTSIPVINWIFVSTQTNNNIKDHMGTTNFAMLFLGLK